MSATPFVSRARIMFSCSTTLGRDRGDARSMAGQTSLAQSLLSISLRTTHSQFSVGMHCYTVSLHEHLECTLFVEDAESGKNDKGRVSISETFQEVSIPSFRSRNSRNLRPNEAHGPVPSSTADQCTDQTGRTHAVSPLYTRPNMGPG